MLAAVAGAAALLAVPVARGGGTVLHEYSAEPGEHRFGWSVAGLGDVDQDGTPDFAIGASGADASPLLAAGSFTVYSGADGTMLYRVRGDAELQRLGSSIAAVGDVNADGRPDFVVGAPGMHGFGQPLGHARVCSGLDGSEILRVDWTPSAIHFGESVANVGDVTGDGVADFAVGAPGVFVGDPGSVRVFSGADGSAVLALAQSDTDGGNLGLGIAGLGDVTGDGVPDFAVSAPSADPKFRNRRHIGEVRVVSGADGSVVRRHVGRTVGDFFGTSIASAGDMDRDGIADLLVGARGVRGVGEATLWSGRTGKKLWSRRGIIPEGQFGSCVAALGDVDADGRPEVAVGSGNEGRGDIVVFSLGARRPIHYHRGGPDERVGDVFAPIGDLDGDSRPELLVGGSYGGVARVLSVDATPIARPVPASLSARFTAPAELTEPAKGSFSFRVRGIVQTVKFKFKGLRSPADLFYGVWLEDGPAAGTYRRIAIVWSGEKSTIQVAAQFLPPGFLGITSIDDLAGRRIEVRDDVERVVLELLVP